jgi:hypothetical protein
MSKRKHGSPFGFSSSPWSTPPDPDLDDPLARVAQVLQSCSMYKLPGRSLIYCPTPEALTPVPREDEDLPLVHELDWATVCLSDGAARHMSRPGQKIMELQLLRSWHLLQWDPAEKVAQSFLENAASTDMLLSLLDDSCDGILLLDDEVAAAGAGDACRVIVRQPFASVRVVDTDKRPGVTQLLLSDMFRSLRL